MFAYYEGESLLHRMNPSVKLAAMGFSMIGLTLVFDPLVPGALLTLTLLAARVLGRVPLGAMAKGLSPFVVLALGFLWMQVAFARGDASDYTLLVRMGPISVFAETVTRGAALGLRVMCYAGFGLLFVATTDPSRLVLSLIQQVRLSPRYGYGLLAAYRFFPLYQSEFRILRAAHQVRGVEESRGVKGRVNQLRRYAIPLLASAVRRAERVAIAMESRGFTGSRDRSYYTVVTLEWKDWLLGAGFIVATLGTILAAEYLGVLRLWEGSLYF